MDLRLDGKTALVTGASKGIGFAIAKAMAESGAKVMLSSRKQEGLEKAAAEIDGEVDVFAANAGEPDQAEACITATIDRFSALDILVNNAATNPYYGPLMGISESQAAKTTQVNQWGLVLWSQLVWRAWMATHGGSIINVASVGGLTVERAIPYYNATKAAVIHLTRHLAVELGPGVRVNAIAPGLVKTDFARALWEDHGDELAATLPLRRLGEPADIAGAAVFLASEAASWITGVILPVDGGLLVTDPPVSGDSLSSA
jgi:NAD(P)-dependent dehydrogenase (short-subunit alcohol dehydrogenase family)